MIVLSILIPTITGRESSYTTLYNNIQKQLLDNQLHTIVEVLTLKDNKELTVGKKRQLLAEQSAGTHVVYIDDDDDISDDYCKLITDALLLNPDVDCVGIQGVITTNGKNQKQWYISKEYKRWFEKDRIYYRTPNHISPVKRTLCLQTGFDDIKYAEDYNYSIKLLPLLQTEVLIKTNIYHYKYCDK
jgi:hypothetical protein